MKDFVTTVVLKSGKIAEVKIAVQNYVTSFMNDPSRAPPFDHPISFKMSIIFIGIDNCIKLEQNR